MSGNGDKLGEVTDLDLMLYFDGELPDERRREVEHFLAQTNALAPDESAEGPRVYDARRKLAGLALAGDLVRESMGDLVREASRETRARDQGANGHPDASLDPGRTDLTAAIMARLDEPLAADGGPGKAVPTKAPTPPKPANDNARRIWGLAVVAAAAAAGLLFWGLGTGESGPDAGDKVVAVPSFSGNLPEPTSPASGQGVALAPDGAPDLTDVVVEDDDAHLGVEVSSVDFGSKSGTIFYVPASKGTTETPTTVVWLADGEE